MLLDELNNMPDNNIELRMVGSPVEEGKYLSDHYDFIEYLGELTDAELRDEARTWSSFVHPVFCYAMGCSTKLAVALGWEIPILTTTMGTRGYVWKEGNMPIADKPELLARLAIENADPLKSKEIKKEISKIRNSLPKIHDIASIIRTSLEIG